MSEPSGTASAPFGGRKSFCMSTRIRAVSTKCDPVAVLAIRSYATKATALYAAATLPRGKAVRC